MNKIFVNYQDISSEAKSKITKGSIIPRPIAWVSTTNDNNTTNLAPFSFFNVVNENYVSISITNTNKDTLKNLQRTKTAVINIASSHLIEDLHLSGKALAYGESELDLLNLTISDSHLVKDKTINETLINFETQLKEIIKIESETNLVILKIVGVSLAESIYNKDKHYIDDIKLNPLARSAGSNYAKIKIIKTK